MKIHVRLNQSVAEESARAHIECRLRLSLSRLAPRIRSVTVQIVDINGPKGGEDKTCRIDIRLLPSGRVFIEDTDADLFAAVDRAADRAARSASRAVERARDSERDTSAQDGARHASALFDMDE